MKRFYSSDYIINSIKEVVEITPYWAWKEGEEWYPTSSKICIDIGNRYGKELITVAGVMSALSVMQSWSVNIIVADLYFQGVFKHLGRQIEKCKLIEKASNKEEINDILGGSKTIAFFNCLNNPYNNEHVVIDRHQLKIAGILEETVSKTQYKFIENCYKAIAEELNIKILTLQAATWLNWRTVKKKKK